MSDKKTIHPYYDHAYGRYDLNIDDIILKLKEAGYLLDDTEDSDDDFDTLDPSLRLEVLSTRGTRCNTTGFNTILYPRLYKNNIDITDSVAPSNFKWQRISGNSEVARLEDAEWNLRYAAGSKECYITKEDIKRNSTFTCLYIEYNYQDISYVNSAYKAYIENSNINGGDK